MNIIEQLEAEQAAALAANRDLPEFTHGDTVKVWVKIREGDKERLQAYDGVVIARSGASTVAELTVIGRPAILVPLPGSIDADQKNNALVVEAAGGGWIAEQATLSPPSLATRLASLFGEPEALQRAAAAAKSLGRPQAVETLADVAERLAVRGK